MEISNNQSYGHTGIVNEFVMGKLFQQNYVADKTGNTSFSSILASLRTDHINGQNLEDMLKEQYPELKYHVLDTANISQSFWERQDYPFEKFFEDDLDESILDWKPSGANPSMLDSNVQARLNALRGKKAVIVPPILEEKINNNPELAQDIMDKISRLIAQQDTIPSTIDSFVISLDEEGNIAHYRLSGGGGAVFTPHWGVESEEENTEREKMIGQAAVRSNQSNDKLVMPSRVSPLMQDNDFAYDDLLSLAGFGFIPYTIDKKKE